MLRGLDTVQTLWMYAHGVDQRVVEPCTSRRSVGAECNYGVRCEGMQDAEHLLRDLAAQVSTRLKAAGANAHWQPPWRRGGVEHAPG